MSTWFDESRLDDERVLAAHDAPLRHLAESGARVRLTAAEQAGDPSSERSGDQGGHGQPRAVVAAGPDARLLRAVLEPWCPVPFVAWPAPSLPGWAGSLDLVVVLAPDGNDHQAASTVAEAVRRGCQVVVACPPGSLVAEHAAGRWVTVLPARPGDQLATAVVVLEHLHDAGLGPSADPEAVAASLDLVAISCSPHRDIAVNPAKAGAIAVADAQVLLWGGSVLAARAARRIAEAVRRTSRSSALAADAEHLVPILEAASPRSVFDDPVEDGAPARPVLVVLDDGGSDELATARRRELEQLATSRGVRVDLLSTDLVPELTGTASTEVARYAALVLLGRYSAAYLGLGQVED